MQARALNRIGRASLLHSDPRRRNRSVVAQAAVCAVDATGVDDTWRRAELNESIILGSGKTLPQYLLDSLHETRIGLKGPVAAPIAGGFQSVGVALRKALDLFANVRPVQTLPGSTPGISTSLGELAAAQKLKGAGREVYADGKYLTAAVGGSAFPDDFTHAGLNKD